MKVYTFKVSCAFSMQYTFLESEVAPDPDGDENDIEPTGQALEALQNQIEGLLSDELLIQDVEVWTGSDELLGTNEEPA